MSLSVPISGRPKRHAAALAERAAAATAAGEDGLDGEMEEVSDSEEYEEGGQIEEGEKDAAVSSKKKQSAAKRRRAQAPAGKQPDVASAQNVRGPQALALTTRPSDEAVETVDVQPAGPT